MLAAFEAEHRASQQPRTITLTKGSSGLGFNVIGGQEQKSGIFISRIIEGGVAQQQGDLRVRSARRRRRAISDAARGWRHQRGDQIVEVDGEDVANSTHARCVQVRRPLLRCGAVPRCVASAAVAVRVRAAATITSQLQLRQCAMQRQ